MLLFRNYKAEPLLTILPGYLSATHFFVECNRVFILTVYRNKKSITAVSLNYFFRSFKESSTDSHSLILFQNIQ